MSLCISEGHTVAIKQHQLRSEYVLMIYNILFFCFIGLRGRKYSKWKDKIVRIFQEVWHCSSKLNAYCIEHSKVNMHTFSRSKPASFILDSHSKWMSTLKGKNLLS